MFTGYPGRVVQEPGCSSIVCVHCLPGSDSKFPYKSDGVLLCCLHTGKPHTVNVNMNANYLCDFIPAKID